MRPRLEPEPRPGARLVPPAVPAEATAMASLLRDDHPRRGHVLLCPVDNAATEEIQPGAPCRKRWRAVTQVGADADRDRAKLRSNSPGLLCGARAERSDQHLRECRPQIHPGRADRRLSEALPVYAAPDQDVCGV